MLLTVRPQHNFIKASNELLDIFRRNTDDPLTYRYQMDPRRRSIRIDLNNQNHILTSGQFRELHEWAKKYS